MESNKQIVKICTHCGNETLMNKIVSKIDNWDEGYGFYGWDKITLLQCPVCNKMTLIQESEDSSMGSYINEYGEERDYIEEVQLYPTEKLNFNNVPKNINDTYNSALRIKNITPDISIIALRKTLELICNDQNAKGRNLESKINDLFNKEIFSSKLKDISKITKRFGNLGAHEDIKINNKELNYLFDFVTYIIEYLYVIPYRINELENKLNDLNNSKNDSNT
ncbi:MAG: DUF4145 domain-containing protein [Lachnospirales bacterium]